MDRVLGIGEDDILSLLDLTTQEGEGRSIAEIAREKHRSKEWVRQVINAKIASGEAEFAGYKRQTNMAQRTVWVPVYRRKKDVVLETVGTSNK